MAKCKFCFTKLPQGSSKCSICKIDVKKEKTALSPDEKKIAYQCRTLHLIGFLAILGGIIGIAGSTISFLALRQLLASASQKIPAASLTIHALLIVNILLVVYWIVFGLALVRLKRWCYVGGIILYSLSIIMNLVSLNLIAILFSILFLYYIAMPLTKKILYREI